ncbi:MAG: hypothetical protein AAF789_12485 [Bacteroidota bacterium]
MKKNTYYKAIAVCLVAFAISCHPAKKEEQENASDQTAEATSSLTVSKAPPSPEYPYATLTKENLTVEEADGKYALSYTFNVESYELGAQTADAANRGIANSGKGQHIHYIVNNGPYAAHYMNEVPDKLEAGNYVVLAFLSRSYHESVKSANAYFIENITVGDVEPSEADLTVPHLFYSRPKGTYSGADTEKVMLDFFLLNTSLAPDGNKIKAVINGEEFTLDEWAPYFIEGLPLGESTIELTLIDASGNPIEGPFNSVSRTITLEE